MGFERMQKAELELKAQENFTDPDSRIVRRAGGGLDYSYNAQAALNDTAHIIVAAELTNSAADSRQLPAVLAAVKRNTGADAGSRSEEVLETLHEHPANLVVALGKGGKRAWRSIRGNGSSAPRWQSDSSQRPRKRATASANGCPNRRAVG